VRRGGRHDVIRNGGAVVVDHQGPFPADGATQVEDQQVDRTHFEDRRNDQAGPVPLGIA
jgi:hypothetical protein